MNTQSLILYRSSLHLENMTDDDLLNYLEHVTSEKSFLTSELNFIQKMIEEPANKELKERNLNNTIDRRI